MNGAPATFPLRRVVALGLLGLLLAFTWLAIVVPLRTHFRSLGETVGLERERYGQLQRRLPDLADLRRQREALARDTAQEEVLLAEANERLASAALQSKLRGLLSGSGGTIKRASIIPVRDENGLIRIGLQIATSLPEASLVRFLEALDRERPYLFVDHLHLRARRGQRRAQPPSAVTVDLEAQIYGYMKGKS